MRDILTPISSSLGNEQWKRTDDYAYYDQSTVTKAKDELREGRTLAESQEQTKGKSSKEAVDKLRSLVEACVKNNFVGVENPRLYSETYYGTKRLAQDFIDELHSSLRYLLQSSQMSRSEKYSLAQHLHTNYGRTALFLSGGASCWNASFTPYLHPVLYTACVLLHSVYIPRNVDWNIAVIGLSVGTTAYIGILSILDRIYILSIQ